jgi:signal transduction histidine kinase
MDMNKGKVSGAAAVWVFLVLVVATSSFADDAAKRKVLTDGVDYGVKLIESKGKAALDELKAYRFGDGKGYVYVTDMNAVVLMHPVAPELLNKDCTAIKDAAGKYFGAEMKHKAIKNGSGWTSYMWPNPAKNKQPEPKCSYFKSANMGGTKVIVYAADFGISETGCN